MNKKNLIITDIAIFLATFLIYLISALAVFLSVKNSLYKDIQDISFSFVSSLNDSGKTEDVIFYCQSSPDLNVAFYHDEDELPYLDSNSVAKDPIVIEDLKLNQPSIQTDSSLDFKVCNIYSYCSGINSYIRIEKQLPNSYYVSRNFLIYGSVLVFLLNVGYMVYSVLNFKKSLLPLKSQINKLQRIISTDRPIEYDDDIKYLALMVRDSRKELAEQFEMTKTGEQKISFILDSFSQGLIVFDASYNIVMINKKASEIFSVLKEDVESKNIEVLHASHLLEINLSMAIKISRSMVHNETINGRIYQCDTNPIDYSWTKGNEPNGASLLLIDVTEEENSSKMKKEFFDNASHELKSPLTSILGYQQMMQAGIITSKEETDDAIAKSIKECNRMNKIIMDMLSLSSLENEELRPVEEIEVTESTRKIVDSLDYQLKEKNIKVLLNPKEKMIVKMNFVDFDRLMRNLIDNAIKYNKENGDIFININSKDQTISVRDTGIGISPENQNRVFERFFRVDKARFRENGGTGLGLAIVKHICNYYEFKIDIASKFNEGTEFILTLPKDKKQG